MLAAAGGSWSRLPFKRNANKRGCTHVLPLRDAGEYFQRGEDEKNSVHYYWLNPDFHKKILETELHQPELINVLAIINTNNPAGHEKLTNGKKAGGLLATASSSSSSSGTHSPLLAPGGTQKPSLGVFHTTAASWLAESLYWLSTASLKGTWWILRVEGEKKSIWSSHAPLGAKATLGVLKDARADRI